MGRLINILPIVLLFAAPPALAQEKAQKKEQSVGGITSLLIEQIEGATGFKFGVGKVSGNLLSALTLTNVTIRDRKGVFARVGLIRLDWSPSGLFSGNVRINELKLADLSLLRKPLQAPKTAKPFDLGILDLNFSQPIDLQFRKLEISNIRIAAGVLSAKALAFNVNGQFFLPRNRRSALISLVLDRVSGPGPQGRIKATLIEDTGLLTIDTLIREAPNGVVGNLLGLRAKDALTVSVQGKGTLDDWTGKFLADAGELSRIQMDLGLREKGSRFLVDGTATSAMLSQKYAQLGTELKLKLDLSWPGENRIALNTLAIRSALLDLTASGLLLPAENRMKLNLTGAFDDLSLLEKMTGLPIGGKGRVTLAIEGTPVEPVMDLRLTATDARFERYRAKSMTVTARIQPKAGKPETGPDGTPTPATTRIADLKVVAEGAQVDGPESARRLLESATIEVKGVFDTQTQSGTVEKFHMALDDAVLDASGKLRQLGPLSFAGKFSLKGSLKPDLLQGARMDDADLAGTIDIDMGRQKGAIQLKGTIDSLKTAQETLDPLLKGQVQIDVDGSWDGAKLTARAFRLKNDILALTASGTLAREQNGTFKIGLTAASLKPFSGLAGMPLTGDLKLDGVLTSSTRGIGGDLNILSRNLAIKEIRLGDVVLRLDGDRFLKKPDARLKLTLTGGRFDGTVAAAVRQNDQGQYALASLNVDAAGVRATGSGVYRPETQAVTGTLKAAIQELRRIAQPFGIAARGRLNVDASVQEAGGGAQSGTIRLRGQGLRYRSGGTIVAVRRIRLNARVADVKALSGVSGTVTAQRLSAGSTRVDRLSLRMNPARRGRAVFRLVSRLRLGDKPVRIDGRGLAAVSADRSTVWLTRLNARYGAVPIRLLKGGAIRLAGSNLDVTPHLLNVAGGRVRLFLRKRGAGLRGRVQVTGMPARAARTAGFGPPLRGVVNANAVIGGSTSRPVVRFDATGTSIRRVRAPTSAALSLKAKGVMAGSALNADLLVTSADPEDRLNIDLRLAGAALRAQVKGSFGLGRLSDSGLVWRHRATGRLVADLSVTSTGAAPTASGRIAVRNGRFVNAQSGAILDGINLQLVGSGSRIRIVNGSATDGDKGRIRVTGYVDVSAARGYPVDLSLQTDRAKLFRLDDAQAVITSRLKVQGAVLRQLSATGDITIDSADIIIPDRLPASITVLDVVEINGGKRRSPQQRRAAARNKSSALPVRLAVNVRAPRRFYIRGRGLDVEFGGGLTIRGTSAKPVVAGQLRIVRGRLDLLGKRFDFRRGNVRFNNPNLANPSLFLIAEATTEGVKGIITISGTVKRPKFTVTSEPALPRDEVLARIMFGKRADELSTTEALRLAAGAVTLFGPGGAGVTDRIRRATGLDVIDVTSGPEGPRALAGKYISDRVLLKIEQGIGRDSSAVGVEVEVRKNIKVETKFNSDGSGRIGLKWRKDY